MEIVRYLSWGNEGWLDDFFYALCITISLSICAFIFGLFVGLLAAVKRLKGNFIEKKLSYFYTIIFRGVPEILFIYLMFFGGSRFLMFFTGLFGYDSYIEVPPFVIGIVAIGCISGSYSSEVFRGSILAIKKGQTESALSLGMKENYLFKRIILPQAIRNAIPSLGNIWQLTLKDTALISVAGLTEIMSIAKAATTYERSPFFFLSFAAILFLLLTVFSTALQRKVERYYNKGF